MWHAGCVPPRPYALLDRADGDDSVSSEEGELNPWRSQTILLSASSLSPAFLTFSVLSFFCLGITSGSKLRLPCICTRDFCLRKLLWLRALHLLGRSWADSALADRDNFVQVCLLGQSPGKQAGVTGPPSVQQAAQVCILHLHTRNLCKTSN